MLTPNFNKPFDIIAVSNVDYKSEKATFPEKSGLFEIWRPRADDYDNGEIYHDFYKIRVTRKFTTYTASCFIRCRVSGNFLTIMMSVAA